MTTHNGYDFSKSNLILMIGGQLLFLALLIMILFFGPPPTTFPTNAVRQMVSSISSK